MKAKLFLCLAVILAAIGCTRKIYMPTETRLETHIANADTTQTEKISKLIDQLQKSVRTQEKVVIRDSVIYVVNEAGAVVSKEVYRDKDRDYSESEAVQRVTQIYDSLFQRQAARTDSILSQLKQESVVVEVEKKRSLWQKIKDGFVGASVLAVFVGIFLLFRWLKSKIFH